jgi:hypothetical protein
VFEGALWLADIDGVEIGRVRRQVDELEARVLSKLSDPLTLVDAEVAHHHQLPALVLPPSQRGSGGEADRDPTGLRLLSCLRENVLFGGCARLRWVASCLRWKRMTT